MANAIYPKFNEQILGGQVNCDLLAGDVKCALIDAADYTYSAAHEFLSDVAGAAIVSTSGNLASKTVTNGLFDSASVTFTSVTGDVSEALILYVDTGVAATSRLIAYRDTGVTGLPVTPSGGNIIVNVASGWIQLGSA